MINGAWVVLQNVKTGVWHLCCPMRHQVPNPRPLHKLPCVECCPFFIDITQIIEFQGAECQHAKPETWNMDRQTHSALNLVISLGGTLWYPWWGGRLSCNVQEKSIGFTYETWMKQMWNVYGTHCNTYYICNRYVKLGWNPHETHKNVYETHCNAY